MPEVIRSAADQVDRFLGKVLGGENDSENPLTNVDINVLDLLPKTVIVAISVQVSRKWLSPGYGHVGLHSSFVFFFSNRASVKADETLSRTPRGIFLGIPSPVVIWLG